VLRKSLSPEDFARTLSQVLWMTRLLRIHHVKLNRTLLIRKDIFSLIRQANTLVAEASRNPVARSKLADFVPILIEDDVDQTFLLLRAFAKARLPGPCDCFTSGDEAIAFLCGRGEYADRRRHPLPSLVILDLGLPRKSGFEVLQWIRQESRVQQLPVVILSSSTDPADEEHARRYGASLFLPKPIGLEAMLETVHAIAGYWAISAT
jgi:CheY-like chemotaxis protein